MPQDRISAPGPQAPFWIDAHCHLADPRVDGTRDRWLAEARAVGVGSWIQGGVGPEDWDRQKQLRARMGPVILTAYGLHPWWVASQDDRACDRALATLETRLSEAAALGELGLDESPRHCRPDSLPRQRRMFEAQLRLGRSAGRPLVLHIVRAHPTALPLLRALGPFPAGGLVHSFSAGQAEAKSYLDLGFHLSVGGSVTREGFQNLKKAVASVPLDRLVIETDAPDQTPRLAGVDPDGPNEPRNLVGIAAAVATLRGETMETILNQSAENLKRLFRI